jgi:geranylgeranyl reductase family protein
MKNYDAVIIGAGLAGLQCAKLLSQKGAKILLVDRKKDLSKGIHTTGIFVRKTLEDFEFPANSLGKAVRNVTLYSPKLKAVELESEKDEFRVGKMAVIYNSLLEEAVENGVNFARGTAYKGAEIYADGSVITLEKRGETYEVKAKVLIGADGANSRVARDLKLDENKELIVGYEEVYHSKNVTSEPRLHCFLDAKLAPGYLAWIADDGEEIHIGVGGYASEFNPREALKSFKEKTRKIFDSDDEKPMETRGGQIPVGGILQKIANTHGLLIGDAAGAVSPLTAGGLDPCLRLSKFASEIIWERLKTDDPKILLSYSGELFRARFISRLWMRRMIKIFTNQTILEFGCAFLRGKIGRKLARHVFFGRGSFPDVQFEKRASLKQEKTAEIL